MGAILQLPDLLDNFDRIKSALDEGKVGILKAHLNQAHRGIMRHHESYKLDEVVKQRLQDNLASVKKSR